MLGAVWSVITRLNEHVDELPTASEEVNVIICDPVNVVPTTGLWITVGVAVQLSLVVADPVKAVTVAIQFASPEVVVFAGQVMLGGVWSATVTTNEQVAELPAASVAVRVTVWLPVNVVPATGLWVLVGLVVQLSAAVAAAV